MFVLYISQTFYNYSLYMLQNRFGSYSDMYNTRYPDTKLFEFDDYPTDSN